MNKPYKNRDITVHVPFASAPHEPYKAHYPSDAVASSVLADALSYYHIQPDGGSRYYFLVDGHEVPGEATLASLVKDDKDHNLKLPLRTETISG